MKLFLPFIFFLFSFSAISQQIEVDFDAVDSLYREDQFYLSITINKLAKTPSGFKQNEFSPGFSFGFLRDMPINKKRTLAFATGVGYTISVLNQNLKITSTGQGNQYSITTPDDLNTKDKLSLHSIEVPLEFRWRTSTPESHKFWRVYSGIKFSYIVYDKYKYESTLENYSITNNPDINKFQYGVYLSAGWNTWNPYVYYGLNPLFKSGSINSEPIDLTSVNFGLIFYIL